MSNNPNDPPVGGGELLYLFAGVIAMLAGFDFLWTGLTPQLNVPDVIAGAVTLAIAAFAFIMLGRG